MDIKEFFQDAVRKQASDIFLIPGMPLAMKINGRIEPVGEERYSRLKWTIISGKFTPSAETEI